MNGAYRMVVVQSWLAMSTRIKNLRERLESGKRNACEREVRPVPQCRRLTAHQVFKEALDEMESWAAFYAAIFDGENMPPAYVVRMASTAGCLIFLSLRIA